MRITVLTHLEKEGDKIHDVVVDQVVEALKQNRHRVSVLGVHGDTIGTGRQLAPDPPSGERPVVDLEGGDPRALCLGDEQRPARREGHPVGELQVVHHLPQDAVLRILVHRAGTVGHVGSGTGGPRVGEEQVALGVEVEVVGAFKQLVAPSVDERLQLFCLRIVGEDAPMPRRQV